MKKFIVSLSVLFSFILTSQAQVDNYTLYLSSEGSVDYSEIPEIDNLDTYTIQFWLNAAAWTPSAEIFSRGTESEKFSATLEANSTITFVAGTSTFSFTNVELLAEAWQHITLTYADGTVKVYLNGELSDTESVDLSVPASSTSFTMGDGNFSGQIDEFRIWDTVMDDTFFHLWRNTLNKHHPQWDNLLVYYKFDQNLCDNVVDYTLKHHGTFSSTGSERQLVTDNTKFKYRIASTYSNFSRWADRQIDKDKYLLANDLLLLDLQSSASGKITLPFPYNEGQVTNGEYLSSYEGRSGVLSLKGSGAFMDVGTDALNPTGQYSFSTWIYLEEWTEGAFLFKKEKSDTEGFSIRLGDEAKKRIYVRVNGVDYSRINYMKIGQWIHLSVSAYSTVKNQVFITTFDGEDYFAVNNNQEDNSYTLSGLEDTHAFVGQNINAKFDETILTQSVRKGATAVNVPTIPSDKIKVEALTLNTYDSFWNYDDAENVGYDSFSGKHFISLMRANYAGHRGFMIRGAVASFEGWESSFTNSDFISTFATEVARVAEDFDGIDLDFEWCYSDNCWGNYGKVIEAIRSEFPSDKVFTVTPHYVSYRLPNAYVSYADYFMFQIYGPGKDVFLWDTYLNAYDSFSADDRYPDQKIVMSYATTTSRGYDAVSDEGITSATPIGIRNLFDENYSPEMNSLIDESGYRRYITGYNQVIDRCEFIQDNDLAGIMYWDMGNDVLTSHPYSLAKGASYSINSNVDTLITYVGNPPSSIRTVKADTNITIFPNPVKNEFSVEMPAGEKVKSIEIKDMMGKVVLVSITPEKVDVSALKNGLYLVSVLSETNNKYCTKIII